MERLRFVVESLQGMAAGQMELEGDALQGLTALLEEVYLDLLSEQRQAERRIDGLQKRLDVLMTIKGDELAEALMKSVKS